MAEPAPPPAADALRGDDTEKKTITSDAEGAVVVEGAGQGGAPSKGVHEIGALEKNAKHADEKDSAAIELRAAGRRAADDAPPPASSLRPAPGAKSGELDVSGFLDQIAQTELALVVESAASSDGRQLFFLVGEPQPGNAAEMLAQLAPATESEAGPGGIAAGIDLRRVSVTALAAPAPADKAPTDETTMEQQRPEQAGGEQALPARDGALKDRVAPDTETPEQREKRRAAGEREQAAAAPTLPLLQWGSGDRVFRIAGALPDVRAFATALHSRVRADRGSVAFQRYALSARDRERSLEAGADRFALGSLPEGKTTAAKEKPGVTKKLEEEPASKPATPGLAGTSGPAGPASPGQSTARKPTPDPTAGPAGGHPAASRGRVTASPPATDRVEILLVLRAPRGR
jgi:hypothetical protein